MAELSAITAKLARLAAADPQRRLFGAYRHGYRLDRPVGADRLGSVEELVGRRLPDGYREFVTTVAAGGAGPYHGLTPLEPAVREVQELWGAAALGADSPLSADIDFGELLGAPADWDEHAARYDEDPDYAAGWHRLQETYTAPQWYHGRLRIADYGCGDWLFLVVRGPAAGTVWADCTANATGLYCLQVDFLTWYQRWLDDALSHAERGEFDLPDPDHGRPILRWGDNPRYDT